ncbi:MAG: MarR family transcriptional regulator [Acidimicrobiales bacterium]
MFGAFNDAEHQRYESDDGEHSSHRVERRRLGVFGRRHHQGDGDDHDGDYCGLDHDLLRPSGALLAAQISLAAAIDSEAVAGTGLDSTTLDLLVRLELAPQRRLRAVELCRQLQLSQSHISRMLDRAEEAQLVERRADPKDRRAKTVILTAKGQRAVDEFAPRLHAVLDQTIHQILDRAEIENLITYLQRIESAASRCISETT